MLVLRWIWVVDDGLVDIRDGVDEKGKGEENIKAMVVVESTGAPTVVNYAAVKREEKERD